MLYMPVAPPSEMEGLTSPFRSFTVVGAVAMSGEGGRSNIYIRQRAGIRQYWVAE